jgi:transposase-like protein
MDLEAIMAQRKRHTGQFKARVAIEAIAGHKTVNQIAGEYGVHPSQVNKWKKDAVERLPEVLSDGRNSKHDRQEELEARLYQQIGQLTMELDYLKKKLGLCQ